jgi:hypothetical protein
MKDCVSCETADLLKRLVGEETKLWKAIEDFVEKVDEIWGEAMDDDMTEAIACEVLKELNRRNGND